MTVRVIAFVTIDDTQPQALADYLAATTPLLDAAGAQIVQRFQLAEPLIGTRPSQTVVIVDYPDRAAIDFVFQSKAYRDIIPVRDKAFLAYAVHIVEGEGLTEEIRNGQRLPAPLPE